MTAIRSLLVATDFSDGAAIALGRAAQLARTLGAALQVLHVTDGSDAGSARERLAQAVASLGMPSSVRVETGPVPEAILEAARAQDLLVLGAHGAGSVREALLGSTAERLLVRSPTPILVVRRQAEHPYRCVLVPCEYAPPAQRALLLAASVAPDAAIALAHCLDAPGKEAMAHEWLRRLASENAPGRAVDTHVESGRPAQALLGLAERVGADLIVTGKQGRSRTGDLVLGSVTRRLVADSGCDVLVAPLPQAD